MSTKLKKESNRMTGAQILLRDEYTRRSQVNPRYSLRGFAKALSISPTVLSLVMSGKRPLSKQAAILVSERLDLTAVQKQMLTSSARPETLQGTKDDSYDEIQHQTFELIADWVHYAILSLLEIPDCELEPKWVAKRLGINEMQAKTAIERLISLELVKKSRGRWKQNSKPFAAYSKVSTGVTRNFHRGLLEKAVESLENDPIEKRDFSSMTMAIDPKNMPYAIEQIRQFRRRLTNELEGNGKPKEVYNLTVQLFPVSKPKET